jgi:hypothetical protein
MVQWGLARGGVVSVWVLLFANAAGAAVFGAVFTIFTVLASIAGSGAGAGGFGVGVFDDRKGQEEGGYCQKQEGEQSIFHGSGFRD